ncbi:M23 family metallopeptidase [Variovorax sp. J22P271]|uniref:M23 family metallopeptidase n=1 Tax=Variovorax davisae TaxID=3053515 RepID=UPI00257550C2|nr:M23 family metallopeptidase [Variovorax sp. J22P271]MDM0031501.1 M23 family metallopeptidase [Variovorax sp. J22P271]
MTAQYRTFIGRQAVAIACAAAGVLLVGCASTSSTPPKRATPAAAPSEAAASPGARANPSARAESSRSAKAAKPKQEKAPPRNRSDKPQATAKVDRSFLRPAGGAVVSRFDGGANKGVDFGGAKGDPVRAAGDGKVVFAAATLRGYGRLVMIKHDATYMSAYAHNSELLVKEGQAVKRGQVIARMGNTESATVKLHFELRRNGSAIDPMPFLTASAGGGNTADD